tara:strand:- start:807 stop:1088 length:282 start_codon:yes stop_codon:yes gene_type:complete
MNDLFTPLARNNDPQTSHDAAHSVEFSLGRQHQEIVTVLERGIPFAAEQLEMIIGFPVWRRMNELEKAGIVEKTGEQHKNNSGRMANKYRLVL